MQSENIKGFLIGIKLRKFIISYALLLELKREHTVDYSWVKEMFHSKTKKKQNLKLLCLRQLIPIVVYYHLSKLTESINYLLKRYFRPYFSFAKYNFFAPDFSIIQRYY